MGFLKYLWGGFFLILTILLAYFDTSNNVTYDLYFFIFIGLGGFVVISLIERSGTRIEYMNSKPVDSKPVDTKPMDSKSELLKQPKFSKEKANISPRSNPWLFRAWLLIIAFLILALIAGIIIELGITSNPAQNNSPSGSPLNTPIPTLSITPTPSITPTVSIIPTPTIIPTPSIMPGQPIIPTPPPVPTLTGESTINASSGAPIAYICSPDGDLYLVDTGSMDNLAVIPFNITPGIAIPSKDGKKIYVTNGDNLSVLSTNGYNILENITFPENIIQLALSPDGTKLYVLYSNSESSTSLAVVDTSFNSLATIGGLPYTWGMKLSQDGNYLFIGDYWNGSVTVVDTSTNSIVKSIKCFSPDQYQYQESYNGHLYWNCGVAASLATSQDGNLLYVSIWSGYDLSVIDARNLVLETTIPLSARSSAGVSVSPDNKLVYVTNYDDGTISIVNASSNTVVNVVQIGVHPRDIEITPDGRYLYVCFDDQNVKILDTATMNVVKTLDYTGSSVEFE
jgi:YVTN family beta-propeller protein